MGVCCSLLGPPQMGMSVAAAWQGFVDIGSSWEGCCGVWRGPRQPSPISPGLGLPHRQLWLDPHKRQPWLPAAEPPWVWLKVCRSPWFHLSQECSGAAGPGRAG